MATWFRTQGTLIVLGTSVMILPIIYVQYGHVSWYPLNSYDHLIQHGLAYVFLLLFSYINHTVFVPRWFLSKQYGRYALVTTGCLLGVAFLSFRIEQWVFLKPPQDNTPLAWAKQLFVEENTMEPPPHFSFHERSTWRPPPAHSPKSTAPPTLPQRVTQPRGHRAGLLPGPPLGLWAKLIIIFLLGSVSSLLSISVQTANRLRQVENDRLQAELRQLKAQIQPHFLFNTLNSIYALAIRNDERTADTIVKLAEFMRYVIRDAHQDQVPLATEINYITNYVDLQKARLRDAVRVDYRVEGEPAGWQIAPLLLFAFVENAFKYGVNPEEDSPIGIHIQVERNQLQLAVANNKVHISPLEPSTGVGLANTQERLRLLYPDAHQLIIDDTPSHFRVTLTLRLA